MFGEVKQMKKGIQIKEDIYWVGVRDFNNRHFHGSRVLNSFDFLIYPSRSHKA